MASVALLLLVCNGCGGEDIGRTEDGQLVLGRAEVEEVTERGVVPGTRMLVLDGYNGNISLNGIPGTTANLDFVKRARGNDTEEARALLDEILIQESGDSQAYRYVMTSDAPERTAVDVLGDVPDQTRLSIEMTNGNVDLSGIGSPITVEQANGNVRIGGAADEVQVNLQNGNIEIGYSMVPSDARVVLTVANGNIVLTLPDASPVRVDAQTTVGSINVEEALNFTNRRLDPQAAGYRFTGRLGQGTASVELRTEVGSITIREGRVTSLNTAEQIPSAAMPPIDTTVTAPVDTSALIPLP